MQPTAVLCPSCGEIRDLTRPRIVGPCHRYVVTGKNPCDDCLTARPSPPPPLTGFEGVERHTMLNLPAPARLPGPGMSDGQRAMARYVTRYPPKLDASVTVEIVPTPPASERFPDVCSRLDEFFDGELSPDDAAEEFRLHLPGCESCQEILHGRMQEATIVDTFVVDVE